MKLANASVFAAVVALLAAGACSKETSAPAADPAAEASDAPAAAASGEAAEKDEAKPEAAAKPADKPTATAPESHAMDEATQKLLFETPIKTLDGEDTTLGALRGKALLVVNVASKCGLTPQYTDLEALQKEYADKGFTVVGMPCNQFGGQEPGSAEEIKKFCSLTYGVTFPMMEKIEVNGDGRHPIYKALTGVPDAKGEAGDIQWNFEKFVISADGTTVTRFRPRTEPKDPGLLAALQGALPAAN